MYLGIDIGTSAVKTVLIDAGQAPVASASAPLRLSRPMPGWSEQHPDDWAAAVEACLDRLAAERPAELAALKGIGLSGQMHGASLVGRDGKPLRPAILWNDGRAAEEAKLLNADPRFRRITGNLVFPGFTAPKLLWLRHHEPDVFAATDKVLLPKDYLRLWLTGEAVSDLSDASGTAWLDVGARRWSEPLLAATGIDERQMPRLVEGTEPSAVLRRELAARWGIERQVVVAGGAGDNAAAACGLGIVRAGAAFLSLGTSGVLFAATDRFAPKPESAVHAFCHALPRTWHQMGVSLSAAAALDWLGRLLKEPGPELVRKLEPGPEHPAPLLFLPYLSGERTPHSDVTARGAFIGLAEESDRAAVTQAVLEGVAFALAECQAALASAGTRPPRYLAVGGGARSRAWLAIIAHV